MAGSGSSTVDARERARARRIALDVDRARRDERIEAAAAAYIEAFDALAAAVAAGEARLGAAFGALRDEGESVTRIAALCETRPVGVTDVEASMCFGAYEPPLPCHQPPA